LDFFGQSFLNLSDEIFFGFVEVLLDLFEFFFGLFFQLHDKNVFVFDDSFELIDFFVKLSDLEFHFVFLVFEFVRNGIFELEPFFSLIFELIFEDFNGLFVFAQKNGLCAILLLNQCQLLFALCVLDFKVFDLEMIDEVLFVFDF
jgi:hypothetical protein